MSGAYVQEENKIAEGGKGCQDHVASKEERGAHPWL